MRVRLVVDDRVVYRVSEAAKLLDCDMRRIYQHIEAKTLLAVDIRPPGAKRPTYRVTRGSLEAFLQRALRMGAPEYDHELQAAGQ